MKSHSIRTGTLIGFKEAYASVFDDDTFYCAVAQSIKLQNYARNHSGSFPPAYLLILAGGPVDCNRIWPTF
jgi:hypothetical protein